MGNPFNPYSLDNAVYNYDVSNYNDVATTNTGYNVPTYHSTTK